MTDIDQKYIDLQNSGTFLGTATSDETVCPDGVGHFRHYAAGSIYWSPANGAHEVQGAIRQHWADLAWERGLLGYPQTDETTTPDGVGRFNHFENGSIYWTPATGAYEVHGAIRQHWAHLGWETSPLGYPQTDETTTPDGIGRFNHFENGSIYWTPATGAQEVHGAIHQHWADQGWEKGQLGYPLTDETTTPDGIGKFNHFQGGSIYWKPTIGAHEVHGLIRDHWAAGGWETNPDLGYPISDETPVAGGANRFSDFENGVVFWQSGTSDVTELQKLTLGDASQTASQVLEQITTLLKPKIEVMVDGRPLYINSGPFLAGPDPIGSDGTLDFIASQRPVSDYWLNVAGELHNRLYKVRTEVGVHVDGAFGPTFLLDLWIEVFYDEPSRTVFASPRFYWISNVNVPWPVSLGISADDLAKRVEAFVVPELDALNFVRKVPDGVAVVSLKVMPNGDCNVYIASP